MIHSIFLVLISYDFFIISPVTAVPKYSKIKCSFTASILQTLNLSFTSLAQSKTLQRLLVSSTSPTKIWQRHTQHGYKLLFINILVTSYKQFPSDCYVKGPSGIIYHSLLGFITIRNYVYNVDYLTHQNIICTQHTHFSVYLSSPANSLSCNNERFLNIFSNKMPHTCNT